MIQSAVCYPSIDKVEKWNSFVIIFVTYWFVFILGCFFCKIWKERDKRHSVWLDLKTEGAFLTVNKINDKIKDMKHKI